jgi:hypothetical protein
MVLRQLQSLLAGIYDVPIGHDVYDFLVTEPGAIPGATPRAGTDEALLVARDGEGIGVSLFLAPQVLERLSAENPLVTLHGGNLAAWLTALEGVSHFVYLAFNADHDRAISRLELETQAEVDKYVASLWLLRAQAPERFPRELHDLLFERAFVDPRLPPDEVALYRQASRYAARFCGRIARRATAVSVSEWLTELRRFYRLNDARKLAHIERVA